MHNGVRLAGMIESPRNERIRNYRRLRKRAYRYREGRFLAEGQQSVAEALRSRLQIECLICSERGLEGLEAYADVVRERSIPCYSVSDEVMSTLSDTVTPQGIIAVAPLVHVGIERLLRGTPSTVLVAGRVRDPGNLGNMVRIADAAGARGMVVCRECADLYNPKTVRSTAGSIFHLPLAVGLDVEECVGALKTAGYAVLVADAHAGVGMWEAEWPDRLALLCGNEAWGIPEREAAAADGLVRVPLFGEAESLNVSAAAAVILYEIQRRRAAGSEEKGR